MSSAEETPAGAKAGSTGPGFAERSRLRRRLRYLRGLKELGLRDLGGLVLDLRRFGRDGEQLVDQKVETLESTDSQIRALERALAYDHGATELRQAGVSSCTACGALASSEDNFCSNCGRPL